MKKIFLLILSFLNKNAKLIEAVGVLGTMVIILYQVRQMDHQLVQVDSNLVEVKKNFDFAVQNKLHEHKQRVNNILLTDENKVLREVFRLDKERVLYFIMLNDWAYQYALVKEVMNDEESQKALAEMKNVSVGTISNNDRLYNFWNENKEFFDKEFVRFIDPKVSKPDSSPN